MKKALFAASLVALTSACSTLKGPPGPKLYDNVSYVITSENALLLPPTIDKDFMRIIRTRLNEFSVAQTSEQGDLQVVDKCGPRTLKVVQDIASVSLKDQIYVTGSANPFRASATTTKDDDIRMSIGVSVEDCTTGKKLYFNSYQHNGSDPIRVLQDFASWNVGYAYEHQRGPRPKAN